MNEEVIIKFGGDTTAFDRVMRGIGGSVKNAAKGISDSFHAAFSTLAAPVSIAGFIGSIHAAAEKVKEINAGAETTGLDPEQYQRLTYAAHELKGGAEGATSAITKLNVKIGEARSGNEEAAKSFQKWGIDIAGKSSAEIVDEIANRMKEIPDPAQRAAMAVELMGRSGAQMVPLLERGAEAVKEMGSHASIFSKEDLENIKNANEQLNQLGNQLLIWTGQAISAIAELGISLGELSVPSNDLDEKTERKLALDDAVKNHKAYLDAQAAASKVAYEKDMEAYDKYVDWKRGREVSGMSNPEKITALKKDIADETAEFQKEKNFQKAIEHAKKIDELKSRLADAEKSLAEKQRSEQEKYNSLKEREMSIRAEILRKENDVGAFDLKDLAKRAAFKNATHQKLSTNEKNALEARHEFDALEESRASGDAVGVKLHEGKYLGLVGGNDALKSGERDPAGKSERHLEKIQTDMAKLAAACSAQGIKIDTGETQ